MDSTKKFPEKIDAISKTRIPSAPKHSCATEMRTLKVNSEPTHSKIPKLDSTTSKDCVKGLNNKFNKAPAIKKPSASVMSLNIPRNNKTSSQVSSRSTHTKRCVTSRDPTPRSAISEITSARPKTAAEKVAINRNIQAFESIKKELRNCQDKFLKKYETVRNDLPKFEGEYELVALTKNNERELVLGKQPPKMNINCDTTSEELRRKLENLFQKTISELDSLEQLKTPEKKVGDSIINDSEVFKQIEETKKKIENHLQTILKDFLKQIDIEKTKEASSCTAKLETKIIGLEKEVDSYRETIQTNQAELVKLKKSYDDKVSRLQRELEKNNKSLEHKVLEFDELKKKYESLEKNNSIQKETLNKLKTKSIECEEKLKTKLIESEELNNKLKTCAQKNVTQEEKNKSLELSLKEVKTELAIVLEEKKKLINNEDQSSKHAHEINALKQDSANVKKEKEKLEIEVQNLKNELKNVKDYKVQSLGLQEDLEKATMQNKTLHETIRELEMKLNTIQGQASVSRDIQEQLSKLQRADNSNNEKVKKLEMELTRAQFHSKKLEEKIVMDAKLLKVRSNLIESLEKKEHSQKIRLEDLFVKVGEKNNDLHMIKSEILTKTEEFQNLFSTLSTKQLELTRQEHMIKLLQESNERAQTLRVKQEAKIARLESEISQLKQSISIYQDVVLPSNNNLRKALALNDHDSDFADSLDFYIEERRKKRHIDINVKKYEK